MNYRIQRMIMESTINKYVDINTDKYSAFMKQTIGNLSELQIARQEKIRRSNVGLSLEKLLADIKDVFGNIEAYDLIKNNPNDWTKVFKSYKILTSQFSSDKDHISDGWNVLRRLRDYADMISGEGRTDDEIYADGEDQLVRLLDMTNLNAKAVGNVISQAIGRVEGWNLPVKIISVPPSNEREADLEHGSTSFEISILRHDLSFTAFVDGDKIEIDDVIEGGDDDLFHNNLEQHFYFSLINEIRKPGSTSKPGKKLVLYTARPVKDRRLYTNAKTIPVNIFLSSNENDAMGLAIDLAGRGVRDLWRVQIDEKYLVNTLDGRIKHYQTTGVNTTVPVYSMQLISYGEESVNLRNHNSILESKDSMELDVIRQCQEDILDCVKYTKDFFKTTVPNIEAIRHLEKTQKKIISTVKNLKVVARIRNPLRTEKINEIPDILYKMRSGYVALDNMYDSDGDYIINGVDSKDQFDRFMNTLSAIETTLHYMSRNIDKIK